METKLVNGKFSQRKRNGSPAIFGILAAIIGVILAINASETCLFHNHRRSTLFSS